MHLLQRFFQHRLRFSFCDFLAILSAVAVVVPVVVGLPRLPMRSVSFTREARAKSSRRTDGGTEGQRGGCWTKKPAAKYKMIRAEKTRQCRQLKTRHENETAEMIMGAFYHKSAKENV